VDSNQESVAGPHFNGYFGHEPAEQGSREVLVGEDSGIRQAIEMATMIAPTRTPVLIVGERGTGKTSLAKMLHDRSPRHEAPFIELCCSSLTEAQLEQELFGKRPTAYGEPERIGKVAQANGGTLFLDEITALSPALQFKLLRLLRDNEFEPIGSNHTLRSDLRLIVGSQDDLAAMVQDGRFRQDLYYRIGVVTLKLTPLRHRGADLERLTDHFRARFAHDINKTVSTFSSEAIERLRQHDWPGNVQELEHVVKCAMVNCRGHRIETSHLVFTPREAPAPATRQPLRSNKAHMPLSILPLKEALEGPEKQLILQALEALNWNRQETARVLDINRTTLYKKMKKYGLLFDEPIWMN
jgi:two-component system response regulator HydG